jgi:signal peptidase II
VAVTVAMVLALSAWLLDQGTKLWVERSMEIGQQIDAIPPVLYWRYHLNPGAAFSMGTDHTWVFTIIQTVVLGVGLFYLSRLGGSWLWTLAVGGLIGGVAGNLTDRLFRAPSLVEGSFEQFGQGHVVDMIAVPHFAVFNVADSFIVCSIIGLCAMMLFGLNMDGTRDGKSKPTPDDAEANS